MAEADTHTMPSRAERRLSAIFSTDVQGYSRLMGDDEEATIRTLTAYREVFSILIQQHHGRVVDSPGDNLLAEFGSAVDAVRCGVAVQKELAERNSTLPESRKMLFRIGINVGDVIVEAERIYGDGVNIAARIEGLADGGEVCISGTVYDQVEGKLDLGYQDMGEQTVKNITKPIRVYRVLMDPEMVGQTEAAASVPSATAPQQPPALPDKPSIAVLPFLNLSGDPEQEYFSDGMTEDLITDLSKISGLFVISRNSVFLYKGSTVKPEEVSKELGVRHVLEGSVRKAGNRVRITAQLIDATTDYHMWAERYDRQLDDIFALQDEVIQQIVSVLAVKLTAGEQARVSAAPTQNLQAYDAFVRGREEYTRRVREANVQARQLFEQAIALDPEYAEAYAFLGRTYLTEVVNQWSGPSTIEKVFTYGQKAVELDESQPTAHETLAYALLGKKQHDEAISEARKAISYDPNFADAYLSLGEILGFAGQPAEAVPLIEQAMRLNPRYEPKYLWALGHAHRLLGNNEEAISFFKRVVTRNPDHLVAHLMLAASYIETGQHDAAQTEAKEILRINPSYSLELAQQRTPYKDAEVIERQLESLRKAGLE